MVVVMGTSSRGSHVATPPRLAVPSEPGINTGRFQAIAPRGADPPHPARIARSRSIHESTGISRYRAALVLPDLLERTRFVVHRYYDPSTVDSLVDQTGTPYTYTGGGDPVNVSDPLGLFWAKVCGAIACARCSHSRKVTLA